ncbi:MAG: hypothetical protein Ct9H300mP6_08610 [Gammaproteobacteria bacterium]|nr:MAG: hypothetical protein Ct9H300mP6_08610 [Gammaproteobacteria bacterium]
MIENVIGVMGMPVGLGLNFSINNKDYVVPLAVKGAIDSCCIKFSCKNTQENLVDIHPLQQIQY